MRRLFIILFVFALALPICAQQKKTSAGKKAATTATSKKPAKKNTKASSGKRTGKGNAANVSSPSIKKLQDKQTKVQQTIKEKEKQLMKNKNDVKKGLSNILELNSEIDQKQKTIEEIQKDIEGLDNSIGLLGNQLLTLEKQLEDHKARYVKSLRYMAQHRNVQDNLLFVFSADNFAQMYRRLRFVREYAAFQRVQGEQVKAKQEQITAKHKELEKAKSQKNSLLYKGEQEKVALQGKQDEQKKIVNSLQKQQKTIQQVIEEQRKQSDALNAQIDRLVAEEMAKARARAEAEAKKKAEEERKRKEEALAKKKAIADAAAKENARRVAEARDREARAKAAARDPKKSAAERAMAEKEARAAETEREAAELKEKVDNERNKKEVERARNESKNVTMLSSVDRKLSSNFESNRGRLPVPITGSYRIVSHFGQYNVDGLKNVRLDNKGITIKGNSGAQARCIFDGEVSGIVNFDGKMFVMVRHGKYISVYSNLKSVSVHQGQHVSARQTLGAIGSDNIMEFQLRREKEKLNPEAWIGK